MNNLWICGLDGAWWMVLDGCTCFFWWDWFWIRMGWILDLDGMDWIWIFFKRISMIYLRCIEDQRWALLDILMGVDVDSWPSRFDEVSSITVSKFLVLMRSNYFEILLTSKAHIDNIFKRTRRLHHTFSKIQFSISPPPQTIITLLVPHKFIIQKKILSKAS